MTSKIRWGGDVEQAIEDLQSTRTAPQDGPTFASALFAALDPQAKLLDNLKRSYGVGSKR